MGRGAHREIGPKSWVCGIARRDTITIATLWRAGDLLAEGQPSGADGEAGEEEAMIASMLSAVALALGLALLACPGLARLLNLDPAGALLVGVMAAQWR